VRTAHTAPAPRSTSPAARAFGAALALLTLAATPADVDRWAQSLPDIHRVAAVVADPAESTAVRAHAARTLATLHHPTVDGPAALRRALESAAPGDRAALLREAAAALEARLRDPSPAAHEPAFDAACALLGAGEGEVRTRLAAAMLDRALDPAGGGRAPAARCADADVVVALGGAATPRLLAAISLGEAELPSLPQVTRLLLASVDEGARGAATERLIARTRELLAPAFAPTLRARVRALLARATAAAAPSDERVEMGAQRLRALYLTVLATAQVELGAPAGAAFLRTLAADASLSEAERAAVAEALRTPPPPVAPTSPSGAAGPAPSVALDDARRAVEAAAAGVALPTAPPRALGAVAPALRVVVAPRGVAVDHAALVASWPAAERARLATVLPAPWGDALPLAYPDVPALDRFALPAGALRGGAAGYLLLPLQRRLRDLAWIEQTRATATGLPAAPAAALHADGGAPFGLVGRVLHTLGDAGYPRVMLVARGGRSLGAVTVGSDAPAVWGVNVRADGYQIRTPAGWVTAGCAGVAAAPAVAVTPARGRPDVAGLTRCLRARRAQEGASAQRRIALSADDAVPYRDVFQTLLALRETRPGRGDLFPDVQFAVLR